LEITETALLLAKNGAAFVRDFELGAEITAKGNALADLIASIHNSLAKAAPLRPASGSQLAVSRPAAVSSGKPSLYIPHNVIKLCSRCVGCVINDACPVSQLVQVAARV
jgi:hypothetical protein